MNSVELDEEQLKTIVSVLANYTRVLTDELLAELNGTNPGVTNELIRIRDILENLLIQTK